MKEQKLSRILFGQFTRVGAYGFVLVIMTFLGLYGGLYLDRITGMAPNFTLLGLVIGIILGFRGFLHEAAAERRKAS
ncbi:MAG: AtpZ/AtpI family protein [Desulfomonilia bacterium]|jgi:F0F1-type ATP synthase assembly protein I|nr:AtpZ/AtpI family protein [Deltaproteobacteria bacterium]MDX9761247.1 AtpZ/AtpI family protein [Desulfomonilia bacterium]